VITGAGEKAFAAGADIGELKELTSSVEAEAQAKFGQQVFQTIEELSKPVIMAVNGYALGGGCELALCGDFLLASENARFGQPEVNLGIIPGYGGTQRLARAIGKYRAKYYCLTGEMFTAEQAEAWGLVQKVCSPDTLMTEAENIAKQFAKKAPLALHFAKKAIHNGTEIDLANACKLEAAYFGLLFDSDDAKEGISAFLEKRKAHFQGK
jgi:enoyl-CoA hydratase